MNHRDNFLENIKRKTAARAGWQCSFSGCGKLTVGPSEEPSGVANIGEAAHICAASPGGRRYDASMTPEERAGLGNAIWLCSDHAKLIDRDEVTYTDSSLREMKRSHEAACELAVRIGSSAALVTGLLAIGPDVVCTGELIEVGASSWTLSLKSFLIGDVHTLISFIDGFTKKASEDRYILSIELGDGRMLSSAPSLIKQAQGYSLVCPVEPGTPRVDAKDIGSGLATNPETNDLFLNKKGGIARVSGIDYLPQRMREVLSMQRGESPFYPTLGMRLSEYFEAYRDTPWLNLLFKLDVIRQAAIPYMDSLTKDVCTPLQCVTRVCKIELLSEFPIENKLPIRLDLEVQGIGPWTQELSIYISSAEQIAERAKRLAEMAWMRSAFLNSQY